MVAERWRRFYVERDYDRCAYLDGEAMVDHAVAFFERVGVPQSVLSVGCGPAVTEFALAQRYPGTDFVCVDVAEQVVADNRALASDSGLDNLAFVAGALPDLPIDACFDLVYCVATLYFVAAIDDALRGLYETVAAGGHLIVSYPTRDLQSWVREQEVPKRAFFELVERGANLRTAEEVATLLDVTVTDYGELVGVEDGLDGTVVVQR